MIDFLRANTWCSQEEYKWGMTVPQVRLASMDFTRLEYISDNENGEMTNHKESKMINSGEELKNLNDLGIPII
mgnify:FL=1|nr:MAG TPA: hypothetical protein [Caudoviricetes sp.]